MNIFARIAYVAVIYAINAPGWIWAKLRGKRYTPVGGPQ